MTKCIVVADDDLSVATAVAHLLGSQFNTPVVRHRIKQDLEVYVSGEPCYTNVLSAEIVSIPVQVNALHSEVADENVIAVITACGLSEKDQRVKALLKNDVPLLQLGEFHPNKVDFGNFSERMANQTFTTALVDATYELGNFILNSVAPSTI